MNILGMSYMYHDSSAALLRDGQILAAAAEERFTRIKHTVDFPVRSLQWCLEEGGIGFNDLDAIVFYEKPFLKFERILRSHLRMYPASWKSFRAFLPMWLNHKLQVPQYIRQTTGYKGKIFFSDHHYAHAASAFLPSPFDEALVMTTDGTGEWSTLTMGRARGRRSRWSVSFGSLTRSACCTLRSRRISVSRSTGGKARSWASLPTGSPATSPPSRRSSTSGRTGASGSISTTLPSITISS